MRKSSLAEEKEESQKGKQCKISSPPDVYYRLPYKCGGELFVALFITNY